SQDPAEEQQAVVLRHGGAGEGVQKSKAGEVQESGIRRGRHQERRLDGAEREPVDLRAAGEIEADQKAAGSVAEGSGERGGDGRTIAGRQADSGELHAGPTQPGRGRFEAVTEFLVRVGQESLADDLRETGIEALPQFVADVAWLFGEAAKVGDELLGQFLHGIGWAKQRRAGHFGKQRQFGRGRFWHLLLGQFLAARLGLGRLRRGRSSRSATAQCQDRDAGEESEQCHSRFPFRGRERVWLAATQRGARRLCALPVGSRLIRHFAKSTTIFAPSVRPAATRIAGSSAFTPLRISRAFSTSFPSNRTTTGT